ncbi:MAG TPA: flagellin [Symbiobacteriaceae bacterium]|nr:flagellin [Symbiobacteriaceae bacterium]
MRVTNAMMMNQALYDLGNLRNKYAKAQAGVNGRSLERPSEDPQRVVEAMDLSGGKIRLERSLRSGQDAREWLSVAETHLTSMIDQLQSAKEYATQVGGPGSLDPTAREALAATFDSLREGLIQNMNVQHRDMYVFAGQKTSTLPFLKNAGGTVTYQPPVNPLDPADGEIARDVAPGLALSVNVPGHRLLEGGDFIQTLANMSAKLRQGDTDAVIGPELEDLNAELSHLTVLRSGLGVRQNQVQQFESYAQDLLLHIEERMTTITGTDMETAVLRMTEAQNAYQAALASFAKALPSSLLDYLK